MRLYAKIHPEFLDEIIAGHKRTEFRQFEDITLDDGKRQRIYKINSVTKTNKKGKEYIERITGITFDPKLPVYEIDLEVK